MKNIIGFLGAFLLLSFSSLAMAEEVTTQPFLPEEMQVDSKRATAWGHQNQETGLYETLVLEKPQPGGSPAELTYQPFDTNDTTLELPHARLTMHQNRQNGLAEILAISDRPFSEIQFEASMTSTQPAKSSSWSLERKVRPLRPMN